MRSKCGGEHREERVRRSSSRSTSACGAPAPGPAPGPLPPAPHAGAPAPGQLRMREHHLRVQLRAGARPPGPPPCGDLLRVQLRAGEAFYPGLLPVLLPVAPAALLVTRPSHKRKPVAARDARALHASPARRPSMTAIWSRGHRGAHAGWCRHAAMRSACCSSSAAASASAAATGGCADQKACAALNWRSVKRRRARACPVSGPPY